MGKKYRSKRIKISPVAKKIAKSENLDIKALVGTGPGGRITKADVLKALEVNIPLDIFDDHNRIIDHNTDGKHHPEQ